MFKLQIILTVLIAFISNNSGYADNLGNYSLEIDKDLKQVKVTIELMQSVRTLKARNSYSSLFITEPTSCESKQLITFSDSNLLPNSKIRCIQYAMRLNQKQDRRPLNLDSSTMVTTPAEWLFLPNLRNKDFVRIKLSIAKNHNLSVPWDAVDESKNDFRITASPQSADGLLIVGDFVKHELAHKGTNLRIAYLPGKQIDYKKIESWLKQTVENVSLVYGRFPHPNPQIIISPTASSWSRQRSPVPFGRVVRDFGESVQFFIDQRQSLNAFNQDWTATHEFSHLLLPYVSHKNRWISEGFASYYQNILLARSGVYTQERAWQKLYDGFLRGQTSVPELSPNSAARTGRSNGGTMKVYWSGAALALLADIRLRKSSDNKKSLDTTLDALQACCLPSTQLWSGTRLMRKLDQLSDTNVFTSLYMDYANNATFIPYELGFEELGIKTGNRRIHFLGDQDKKELRLSVSGKR